MQGFVKFLVIVVVVIGSMLMAGFMDTVESSTQAGWAVGALTMGLIALILYFL